MSDEHPDDDVRVGHPERERAIGLINDCFSQGYLDITEFEQRAGVVYEARTRGDLRAVVADLPNAHTLFPEAPVPRLVTPVDVPAEMLSGDWDTHRRKGSWTVPARLTLTGQMSTFDLDFRLATFAAAVVELQLQVTASTVRVRLNPDQEIRYDAVVKTGWSSIKDKAGRPARPGGQVIAVTGSIGGMTGMTIKRS